MKTREITVMEGMRLTSIFLLIRFLVIVITVLPIFWVMTFYVDWLMVWLGVDFTTGVVRSVFMLAFAYVGFTVSWILLSYVRNFLLHYVKCAHVIAITKLAVEDAPVRVVENAQKEIISERIAMFALTGEAIRDMFKTFFSTSLFLAGNHLVEKGIHALGELIMKQNLVPILKSNNLITRFLGGTLKTTLSHLDEIVMSYVWFRRRLNELYADGKKKVKFTELLGYVVEGMVLYLKSVPTLLKTAFKTVLAGTVFGWLFVLGCLCIVLLYTNFNIWVVSLTLLISRIAFMLFNLIFLDSYSLCSLILSFYEAISRVRDISGDDSVIRSKLASIPAFSRIINKAGGVQGASEMEVEDAVDGAGGANIFDENLFDLAREEVDDFLVEGDESDEYE